MKKKSPIQGERRWDAAALNELIDEFTVEAAGDDERILAFLHVLETHVALPCDGFVIGEPVSVVKFDYQGNQRRGLTAKFRRADGCEYEVAVSEVALSPGTPGSCYISGRVPEVDGRRTVPIRNSVHDKRQVVRGRSRPALSRRVGRVVG